VIARWPCELCKRRFVCHVDPEGNPEKGHYLCDDCQAVVYTDRANKA
jgi:hypothetical protein